MSSLRISRRSAIARGLLAGVAITAVLPLAGCGEKELPIIPSGKSKDELQKDIENPYGVDIKPPKGKVRRSANR